MTTPLPTHRELAARLKEHNRRASWPVWPRIVLSLGLFAALAGFVHVLDARGLSSAMKAALGVPLGLVLAIGMGLIFWLACRHSASFKKHGLACPHCGEGFDRRFVQAFAVAGYCIRCGERVAVEPPDDAGGPAAVASHELLTRSQLAANLAAWRRHERKMLATLFVGMSSGLPVLLGGHLLWPHGSDAYVWCLFGGWAVLLLAVGILLARPGRHLRNQLTCPFCKAFFAIANETLGSIAMATGHCPRCGERCLDEEADGGEAAADAPSPGFDGRGNAGENPPTREELRTIVMAREKAAFRRGGLLFVGYATAAIATFLAAMARLRTFDFQHSPLWRLWAEFALIAALAFGLVAFVSWLTRRRQRCYVDWCPHCGGRAREGYWPRLVLATGRCGACGRV